MTKVASQSEEVAVFPGYDSVISDGRWPIPPSEPDGVLVIYTGGTIGSAPRDRSDPDSPQVVVSWEELKKAIPKFTQIPFRVDAISFVDALDSANVGPKHWKAIAQIIKRQYEHYVGFVVAHGTDTMVYTASALSFILQNLGKPVIVTGAQLSAIGKIRNDAEQNLITAILIANTRTPPIPEVCIFFRDLLIRGNRCKKVNASGYTAFESKNYEPLAKAGSTINFDEEFVREPPEGEFRIETRLDTNVIAFDIFPGLQDNPELLKKLLETPKGVVLKTYGAGNVPTEPEDLKNVIAEAAKEKIIVNVTQCIQGGVEQGLYDTSAVLQDIGVISGQEITAEAAMCKLMKLIGEEKDFDEDARARIKKLMTLNLAGELDHSISYTMLDSKGGMIKSEDPEHRRMICRSTRIEGFTKGENIHRLILRFIGAKVTDVDRAAQVEIYANLQEGEEPENSQNLLVGSFTKTKESKPQTFTFNLDVGRASKEIRPAGVSFTVVIGKPKGEGYKDERIGGLEWSKVELALYEKRTQKTYR